MLPFPGESQLGSCDLPHTWCYMMLSEFWICYLIYLTGVRSFLTHPTILLKAISKSLLDVKHRMNEWHSQIDNCLYMKKSPTSNLYFVLLMTMRFFVNYVAFEFPVRFQPWCSPSGRPDECQWHLWWITWAQHSTHCLFMLGTKCQTLVSK